MEKSVLKFPISLLCTFAVELSSFVITRLSIASDGLGLYLKLRIEVTGYVNRF